MGNEASSTSAMEKTLFNMKFTSKQLARESTHCEKKEKEWERKVFEALKKGNKEIARVYASNAIREKNQAVNFVRLASRIEAVAGRVEAAIRMNQIANVMDKFESQFDNLDVRSGYMERAIASSTATSVPEDDVDQLLGMVAEKNNLELSGDMAKAGAGAIGGPAAAVSADKGRVAEPVAAAAPPPSSSKPDDKDSKGGPGGGDGGGGGAVAGAGSSSGGAADSLASRLAALRK